MYRCRRNPFLIYILTAALLFGRICVYEQPVEAFSFSTEKQEISSAERIDTVQMNQIFSQECLREASDMAETLRSSARRNSSTFVRRTVNSISYVEHLPQNIHSSVFFQTSKVVHNTSAHIKLIQCLYRGDGKKRSL